MRAHTAFASAGLLMVGLLFACGSSTDVGSSSCTTGQAEACNCADGTSSTAQCVGGTLSTCACSVDGGTDAAQSGDGSKDGGGVSTSDAGFGQYLGPCKVTADCPMGDICFQFGTKGFVCTKNCTDSTQCPAPSPKCNPKMVCAPPDA
ncbi:MAG: hypothetical protein JWO86_8720 [Myxococcaceae bacterium]|nr:hypothetical protein [Myxococcaceae bacterium]